MITFDIAIFFCHFTILCLAYVHFLDNSGLGHGWSASTLLLTSSSLNSYRSVPILSTALPVQ
jgi:hypothetical protein